MFWHPILKAVTWLDVAIASVLALIGKEFYKSESEIKEAPIVEPPIENDPLTKEELKRHLEKFQEQLDPLLDLERVNPLATEAQKHDSIEMFFLGAGIALMLGAGVGFALYYWKKK